jgi:hypothetical protein
VPIDVQLCVRGVPMWMTALCSPFKLLCAKPTSRNF